jgi:hypothetical protein
MTHPVTDAARCPTCKGKGKKAQGVISYVHVDELCPDKWHDDPGPIVLTDAARERK